MKKKVILLIIFFVSCGLSFGDETNDWRYTQICTQGFKGYQKFRSEFEAKSKTEFWKYFYNLIRNFKFKKEFGNIIACSEFWDELKQDELFDFDEDARGDKEEINGIFASAKNGYRKDFKDRMFALEPIDLEGEKDQDKIKEYTEDKKFVHIIQIYANNYKIISENPLPKDDEIDDIAARWQEMSGNNQVKSTIKEPINDYFNKLNEFYRIQVREKDSYEKKLKTCGTKKAKLEEIKKIAASIHQFNIKKQLDIINEMIRSTNTEIKKWQLHKTVHEVISTFEKKPDPTLDDLYETKQKVIDAAQEGKEWEESLWKRIKFFWNFPEKKYLTLEWFEENVKPNMNNNSKRIEILKSVYKERLFGEVIIKMNAGGDSVDRLIQIQMLTEKYKRLFNEKTGKEDCIELIRRYYEAKEKLDYPKMMKLYDEDPNIVSACDNVVKQAWNLKRSKEAVKAEYKKHYLKLMHDALDDYGRKFESDFDEFWLIHSKKHWALPEDYKKRFKYLYTCFKSPNSSARQKAAKDLHKYYPELASSYRIPDPEKDITYIGREGESTIDEEVNNAEEQSGSLDTAENDYKKLVEMWQAVKGMKTEQEVVKYILHQAPLRIKGSDSAQKTLTRLSKRHNQWKNFRKTFLQEFKALAMLGEMQTWSDNIGEQNELYNHILVRMSEENVTRFQMPEPEENRTINLKLIKKIMANNSEYLNLLNGNQSGKNLDSIEGSLKHDLLTGPQRIRAHYQFGILSSELRKDLHLPLCYHFAKAWELMDEKGYKKLNLDWKGSVIIRKSDLANKICLHCNLVKRRQAGKDEFDRQYPGSNLDIDTLCGRVGRLSPGSQPSGDDIGPGTISKDGTTGTGNQEEIIKFMEKMFEFVVNGESDDSTLDGIYSSLISSQLNPTEFNDMKRKYKNRINIPQGYNYLINHFFHIINVKEDKWQEIAAAAIKNVRWDNAIKKEMEKILEEIKEIFK